MVELFGRRYTRADLEARIGDISQVGGVRRSVLADGIETGVESVDVRTGTGFEFTVLPSRGMDISRASFNGVPLCWRSGVGDVGPQFYEADGLGWLQSFFGGLLTTCGLTYVGAPTTENGRSFGLHGRVSNIPARAVWCDGEWQGDEFRMWVQGRVREARVFGEDVQLIRRIETSIGESRLVIRDVVENLGHAPADHMLLYHINIGHPFVAEASRVEAPSSGVFPRDAASGAGIGEWSRFTAPQRGFREQVLYHSMIPAADGTVTVRVVNPELNGGAGLGVYVRYSAATLPEFVQWRMLGEGLYVVGLEPANCRVEGRDRERERGTLKRLAPGERREYVVEIGVIERI